MFNMVLAIVMKRYDSVHAQLSLKAKTEVTGVGMLKQEIKKLMKLMKASSVREAGTYSTHERRMLTFSLAAVFLCMHCTLPRSLPDEERRKIHVNDTVTP